MIQISVNTRRAVVTNKELLTVGSAGIQVQFTLSEDWDTLSKLAVFRVGDDGTKVDVVLGTSLTCVVPPEVLTQEGEVLFIGIYGTNGQGTVIIPTVWASAGVVKPGTEPNTPATAEPAPVIWAQILGVAQDAEQVAGEAYTMAENAQGYADAANAAATRASSAANQANNARGSAQSSASQASASASMAANSALQASASAATASNAATTATTKAGESSTSAQSAAEDAQAAAEAAQSIQASASQIAQNTQDISKQKLVSNDLAKKNNANLLLSFGSFQSKTVGGTQVTWSEDCTTCTISTNGQDPLPLIRLYYSTTALPDVLTTGKTYQVKFDSTNSNIHLYIEYYLNGSRVSYENIYEDQAITIPSDCNGLWFELHYPLSTAFTASATMELCNTSSGGGAVNSVNGQTGDVVLDAGNLEFDDTETYPTGSIGAEVSAQKNAIGQKQDAPSSAGTAGQVLGLDSNLDPVWVNQSGGGTSDYTQLTNKPQINSVTLTGNKSLSDIGAIALPTNPTSGQYLKWNGSAWIADDLPVYNGGVT